MKGLDNAVLHVEIAYCLAGCCEGGFYGFCYYLKHFFLDITELFPLQLIVACPDVPLLKVLWYFWWTSSASGWPVSALRASLSIFCKLTAKVSDGDDRLKRLETFLFNLCRNTLKEEKPTSRKILEQLFSHIPNFSFGWNVSICVYVFLNQTEERNSSTNNWKTWTNHSYIIR